MYYNFFVLNWFAIISIDLANVRFKRNNTEF